MAANVAPWALDRWCLTARWEAWGHCPPRTVVPAEKDWGVTQDDEDDNEITFYDVGLESLDRISLALGGIFSERMVLPTTWSQPRHTLCTICKCIFVHLVVLHLCRDCTFVFVSSPMWREKNWQSNQMTGR